MKLTRLLMVVAFLGISATVALADGVPADPIVFTRGCGGVGQPACDAVVLTSGNTTVTVTEAFTCDTSGNCTATEDVINNTPVAINSFSLVFQDTLVTPTGTRTLIYSCQAEGFFACSPVAGTTNAFTFTGASLCSDENDFVDGVFVPDGDDCGVVIGLNATTSEGIMTGTRLTANFSTPEPSSALLLLFGLMAGLVGLKSFRSILA